MVALALALSMKCSLWQDEQATNSQHRPRRELGWHFRQPCANSSFATKSELKHAYSFHLRNNGQMDSQETNQPFHHHHRGNRGGGGAPTLAYYGLWEGRGIKVRAQTRIQTDDHDDDDAWNDLLFFYWDGGWGSELLLLLRCRCWAFHERAYEAKDDPGCSIRVLGASHSMIRPASMTTTRS